MLSRTFYTAYNETPITKGTIMGKIPYTIFVTAPFAILSVVTFALEIAERKRQAQARAEECARNYANATVFRMYREDRIRDDEHKKTEWNFAYMTHLLENH